MNRLGFSVMAGLLCLAQLCEGADPLDNWSRQWNGNHEFFNSVAYGNGRFVVTGYDINGTDLIVTSSDGTNWTQAAGGMTNYLSEVCFGAGKFVADSLQSGISARSCSVQRSSGSSQLPGS